MIRRTPAAIALLACVALCAPSRAADLPPIFKAAPVPAPYSWTGFYVGAHFGYGWGNKQFFDNFPTPDGELDADAPVRGGLGGLQAGVNYQINWLVLGLEGDFSWSDVHGDFSCFSFGNQVCSAKPEWFGTLTGRLGVAAGPALLFVKGGPAWTNDHFSDLATCAGSQPTSRAGIPALCGDIFVGNQVRLGWTVGLGIEYALDPNWSLELEYDYMDFGHRSVPFYDSDGNYFTEDIHQTINLIKVGINYKFDWASPTPLAVKALGYAPTAANDGPDSGGRVLAFSTADVSKYSYDWLAGVLIAPYKDLDTSGLRVFIQGDVGTYKYPANGALIRGTLTSGDLLTGYAFEGDNYSINLLAGINAINHTLSDVDPNNRVQGTEFGARLRTDAWINPTPQTLTYGEAEYSTAFQTYYTRVKFGYDIASGRQIFFGPEIGALGDERFNQWRLGAHLTQMKLGKIQVDMSAGYARDSIVGSGAYGTIELSSNF